MSNARVLQVSSHHSKLDMVREICRARAPTERGNEGGVEAVGDYP